MKKRLVLVTAVLAIMLVSCVKSLSKEGVSETTTLIGRVVEESSQTPVLGAKVSITNGLSTYALCITKEDGAFELKVNFDEIDDDYFLLIDGGMEWKTIKRELFGMGQERYDYTSVILDSFFPTFLYDGHKYYVAPASTSMKWDMADLYCNSLTINGLSGWRLPTLNELVQMYAEQSQIGGFQGYIYWSSSNSADNLGSHYDLDFQDGSIGNTLDRYPRRARPIRRVNQ